MASNSLKTLIRLVGHEVDEKRRVLLALVEREQNLIQQDRNLDETLVKEQAMAATDPTGIGATYAAFHQHHLQRKAIVHRSLAAVREEIERAREDLAESFRKQKSYELAQQARERREREEADRKEQEFLDEVGLTQFRQKQDAEEV